MNILSLFDGKSSGYTACELAGIPVDNYYSSEIDKYAIKVSDAIHPNQVRLGSVTEWREWGIDWASIDMIFGGFPCQSWSVAGKGQGDKDKRGMLFWVMLDIMKHVRHHNPKAHFLFENVKMKKEFEEYITHHMTEAAGEVYKTLINSALVSAQNRNRYYWTSFSFSQPHDKGLSVVDVIDSFKVQVNDKKNKIVCLNLIKTDGSKTYQQDRVYDISGKMASLTSSLSGRFYVGFIFNGKISKKKLTPRECLRLQTVPEHYIDKILSCGVSNNQLYKIAGNGWTDEVIAHILRCMKPPSCPGNKNNKELTQ